MSEIIQWVITLAFAVVSVALASKFLVEAYLEYRQVSDGIRILTHKKFEKYMESIERDDDDEASH